ncbi:Subtilase family protein [Halogranum amylolyticum]|uniref:Subtilase family protein n=1 Tax=Halogranum amylolyticum TaxID=660520 RepID=A0A1H8MXX3_9EURY|nr:S8 family serine peptidase [Halogranum amylolyticum]SEO22130.1 Subtilase family protein [Halogranum amylolyticum]
MQDWIIFTTGRPEFLYGTDCTVLETYHFGDDVGSAAHVECEDPPSTIRRWDRRIRSVESNYDIGLRTALDFVTESNAAVATIEDVRQLHDVPTDGATGSGQTVVAMDSGVDTSHPLFSDRSIRQVDVTGSGSGDAVGHGTAVLGQTTRLAPEAELISLRIFGSEGRTKTNVIMRAYEWLHAHVDEYDVVNMSWGSSEASDQIDRVHDRLVEKGVRDVVAAGNTGDTSGSPATAERAFSIGACTEDGQMAEFSSYNPQGDNPDVSAIGKDNRLAQASGTTMGTQLSGPWVKASGTSFAAPEVAGMVAKYRSREGAVPPKEILTAFERHARDIRGEPRDGAGLADYAATVGRSTEPDEGDGEWPTTTVRVAEADAGDRLTLSDDWFASGEYTATRLSQSATETILHLTPNGTENERSK